MNIYRYEENPLITPLDVKPIHGGFEVIGAFNGGVAKYNGEILLLLRVAEKPVSEDPEVVLAPVYNAKEEKLELQSFRLDDENYDFEDPRMIRHKAKLEGFFLFDFAFLYSNCSQ